MRHCTLLASGILIALLIAACGGSMTPSPLTPTVPTYTAMPSATELLSEKTLGSESAPNTIIEYVSFWCAGCKAFHLDIAPQIKARYVDTGRARLIFRNLFLSAESTATAAALPRCVGNAKFFEAADRIFRNQDNWLNSGDPDPALVRLMLGFGMSQSLIDECRGNQGLSDALVRIHTDALAATYQLPDGTNSVGLSQVPALVVNNVKLEGLTDLATTLANIDKLLK